MDTSISFTYSHALSNLKTNTNIWGILKINSPYRFKTNHKTIGFLFKPFDSELPLFIVSLSTAHKYKSNVLLSILPKTIPCDSIEEFPIGIPQSVIGCVENNLELYLSYLHHLSLFPKRFKLNHFNPDEYHLFLMDLSRPLLSNVVSVDPEGCVDIDDAFSFHQHDDFIILQISITDLICLLDYSNILSLVSQLVSSIYLPGQTVHMFPNFIMENGSLTKGNLRPLITLEITYNTISQTWKTKVFKSLATIKTNYSYENYGDKGKHLYPMLNKIFETITTNPENPAKIEHIHDSHRMIEVMMIIFNYYYLHSTSEDTPVIYRNNLHTDNYSDDLIDDPDVKTFLRILNHSKSEYSFDNEGHYQMGLDAYIQATSPLRRVIDIYNQCSISYPELVETIQIDIEQLNLKMKQIQRLYRKIQQYEFACQLYQLGTYYETTGFVWDYSTEDNKASIYIKEIGKTKGLMVRWRTEPKTIGEYVIRIWGIPNPENIMTSLKIEFI